MPAIFKPIKIVLSKTHPQKITPFQDNKRQKTVTKSPFSPNTFFKHRFITTQVGERLLSIPKSYATGPNRQFGLPLQAVGKVCKHDLAPPMLVGALFDKRPPAALGTKGWRKHKLLGSLEVWIYLFWKKIRENNAVLGCDSLVIRWFDEKKGKCRWPLKKMAAKWPKMVDLKIVLIVYRNHPNHRNIG